MLNNIFSTIKESFLFKKGMNGSKLSKFLLSIVRWVLIIGISYIILFPVLTKLSSSLMERQDLFDKTVKWIPRHFTLDNYRIAFKGMRYPLCFRNSLILSLSVSLMQLISSTIIGYGFARFDFKGKKILFALVIFTLIVPPQMIMVPLYLNFRFFNIFGLLPGKGINLLGSYWPFILTSLTGTGLRNGLFIFMMRQFFKGMPRDLEEAAYVDGAGSFKTFYKIMLPGAIPAMVTVFLFAFVWQWNDFFLTSIYWGKNTVLPIALDNLINTISKDNTVDKVLRTSQYLSLINNAGMMLIIIPLLILYGFLQRYFVESIERTGLVG